jgi:hypothetical protein
MKFRSWIDIFRLGRATCCHPLRSGRAPTSSTYRPVRRLGSGSLVFDICP